MCHISSIGMEGEKDGQSKKHGSHLLYYPVGGKQQASRAKSELVQESSCGKCVLGTNHTNFVAVPKKSNVMMTLHNSKANISFSWPLQVGEEVGTSP